MKYGHLKKLSKDTKAILYEMLAPSLLFYNSETWALKEVHKRK